MTPQEHDWFDALHNVNAKLVEIHDTAGSPIEDWFDDENDLYSDTAHFVYELLQNADDAGSTEARFELCEDKLVFAHKGEHTRHFTVSPIETKANDVGTERYGSVNALSDRNGTTKKDDNDRGNAIGKFGRGFKSVYAYTRSPKIYDLNLRFKMERFIIPSDLTNEPDYPQRNPNETLFVIPFDRGEDMPAQQAVDQIRVKLRELVFPTLFLRNLESIRFQDGAATGEYGKTVVERKSFANGDVAERIRMSFSLSNPANENIDNLWMFSRTTSAGHKVSVVFFIDNNGSLVRPSSPKPAFCYFPTRHSTGLNFIVHAPFRLTATREKIKEETSEPHNKEMVSALASLAADSIEHLRDLRTFTGASLVTDDIIDIIPTRQTTKADYREQLDLSPFSAKMLEKFQSARVIPIKSGGHVMKANAYWPESEDISEVFSESQLRGLVNDQNAGWAVASRWADRQREPDKYDFIAAITNLSQSPVTKCWTAYQLISRLNGVFMKNQTLDWLFRLHEWIAKDSHRIGYAKRIPIFLNQYNVPVCPYGPDNEQPLLKPSSRPDARCPENRKSKTVLRDFLEHDGSRHLLERYNAHEPTSLDDVLLFLDTEWDAVSDEDHLAVFGSVFEAYCRMSATEQDTVVTRLRQKSFLAKDSAGNRERKPCSELYCDSEELKRYFRNATVFYLDKTYEESVQQESRDCWIELTHRLELASLPRTNRRYDLRVSDFPATYTAEWGKQWEQPAEIHWTEQTWTENEIDCLSDNLASLCRSENNEDKFLSSKTIWDMLRAVVKFHYDNGTTSLDTLQNIIFPQGKHLYQNYRNKEQMFDNLLLFKLRTSPWLKARSGSFKSPRELTIQDLDDGYRSDEVGNKLLQKLLGLKSDDTTFALELLIRAHPELEAEIRRVVEKKNKTDSVGIDADTGVETGRAVKPDEGLEPAEVEIDRSQWPLGTDSEARGPFNHIPAGTVSWVSEVEPFIKGDVTIAGTQIRRAKLRIPPYQRRFAWKEHDVRLLCRDLLKTNGSTHYHLGTIILHREQAGDGEIWDVVDGQQRLTNIMAILEAPVFDSNLTENGTIRMKQFSRRDYEMVKSILEEYGEDGKKTIKNRLKSCTLAFVAVKDIAEAFQLFGTQNGRGKPLTPVNLLKAYHYREMDADFEQWKKERKKKIAGATTEEQLKKDFDREVRFHIEKSWESANGEDASAASSDGKLLSHVFGEYLFRIRNWTRGRFPTESFGNRDIGEFKGVTIHFKEDRNKRQLPLQNCAVLRKEAKTTEDSFIARRGRETKGFMPFMSICQTIVNGEDFFHYAETYATAYKHVFKENAVREFFEFYKTNCSPSQHNKGGAMYARHVFEALCLFCYDLFGGEGLKACYQALFCCAYFERVSQSRVLYRKCGATFAPRAIEVMSRNFTIEDVRQGLNDLASEAKNEIRKRGHLENLDQTQLTAGQKMQIAACKIIFG